MHYIKKKEITLLLLLCVICLSSCSTEEYQSYKAGLFTGIWDGFIFLFTIIGKCFSTDINNWNYYRMINKTGMDPYNNNKKLDPFSYNLMK